MLWYKALHKLHNIMNDKTIYCEDWPCTWTKRLSILTLVLLKNNRIEFSRFSSVILVRIFYLLYFILVGSFVEMDQGRIKKRRGPHPAHGPAVAHMWFTTCSFLRWRVLSPKSQVGGLPLVVCPSIRNPTPRHSVVTGDSPNLGTSRKTVTAQTPYEWLLSTTEV
jgi:hypothetical protein